MLQSGRGLIAMLVAAACAIAFSLIFGGAATRQIKQTPPSNNKREDKQVADPPIVCNLFGLSETQRKRQQELHRTLMAGVKDVRELPDGYGIRFPSTSSNIEAVAEYITLERVCCPFFHFELQVGCEDEPMWLNLTGREGVKKFLKSELKLK